MTIQTPWEKNGSPEYGYHATIPDEDVFINQIVATGKVSVVQVGMSAHGNPIRLIGLGATTAPTFDAHPKSGLWVSTQHTRETSPRESTFTFLRNTVESADPALLAYLTDHPMFIIATPDPDRVGMEADPLFVDNNRDHLLLSNTPARGIAAAYDLIQPGLVVDRHTGGFTNIDIASAEFPGVDLGLRELGAEAAAATRSYLVDNGVDTGPIGVNKWMPVTLRNTGGLRGSVTILTEDYGGHVMSLRIGYNLHALRGIINWHSANIERIASTQSTARKRAVGHGADATVPYPMGEAHTAYDSDGSTALSPPPRLYRLDRVAFNATAFHRESFGIAAEADGPNRWTVDMAQTSEPVIGLLFDPVSTQAQSPALPVGKPVPVGPTEFGFYRAFDRDCPVTETWLQVDGSLRQVWTTMPT